MDSITPPPTYYEQYYEKIIGKAQETTQILYKIKNTNEINEIINLSKQLDKNYSDSKNIFKEYISKVNLSDVSINTDDVNVEGLSKEYNKSYACKVTIGGLNYLFVPADCALYGHHPDKILINETDIKIPLSQIQDSTETKKDTLYHILKMAREMYLYGS